MNHPTQKTQLMEQIREKFSKPLEQVPAELLMKEFYELMGEREKKLSKEKIRVSHYCRLWWCKRCKCVYPRRVIPGNGFSFECDCGRRCVDITYARK